MKKIVVADFVTLLWTTTSTPPLAPPPRPPSDQLAVNWDET